MRFLKKTACAALLAGWVSHGPLGQGEAFIDFVESRSKAEVREAGVPGVEVRFARTAVLLAPSCVASETTSPAPTTQGR